MAKSRDDKRSAIARLRDFFEKNVGRVVTTQELAEVAKISDYPRRIRELRAQFGLQILSHNDREGLKPNQYLLETLELRPVISGGISAKLRRHILDRNGFTCQVCGAGASEMSGCEEGKRCRLQIDHIIPLDQGGTDDKDNLRAVCVWYNKDKSNLKVPKLSEAINILALVRRQPRDVQRKVYEFLARKFGDGTSDDELQR